MMMMMNDPHLRVGTQHMKKKEKEKETLLPPLPLQTKNSSALGLSLPHGRLST